MQDTHDLDTLAGALLDLIGALNSPRQDEVLMREAGVTFDRALFPLLVRIGMAGSLGVVELAEQVGRDHSTISRQVARLEALGLVVRQVAARDQRIREARRRLLGRLLAGWSRDERRTLAHLNRRLADAMQAAGVAAVNDRPPAAL